MRKWVEHILEALGAAIVIVALASVNLVVASIALGVTLIVVGNYYVGADDGSSDEHDSTHSPLG